MKSLFAKIHLILTLDCEQSTRLVSESLDRHLSFSERWAVRLHYLGCWSCRRFRRQLDFIRDAIQKMACDDELAAESAHLPDEARQRIKDAIKRAGET